MSVNINNLNASAKFNNAEWQLRKEAAIARGQGNLTSIYVDRAANAELWDVEGKRYIDFGSGIAVCNTGHLHPLVTSAVREQLERFSHTCVMVTPYGSAVELAEKLNELAPGSTLKKSVFLTTGAEAVENSIKIARAYTGRRGIVAFNGGFHGRTMLAMGLTGKITPYKNLFGPFPGEIYHIPFPISYHDISEANSLNALETLFKVDIPPTDVAAIIIEPVQGEGGFYPASPNYLKSLRKICDEHGIVLVIDEIQTGFARTGKFFCTEYAGIEPDLMTVAKGMAGGFPLSAVIGKADIMDSPLPGGLGGTYGGSPIACAAALAVIEAIKQDNLIEGANQIGNSFLKILENLQHRYPSQIGDIRAQTGAMIAMGVVKNGNANEPDPDLTMAIITEARLRGLILLPCGSRGNVIRFLPALTIPGEVLREGLNILSDCFTKCCD
ncbi:MAG: 4-aminobutyrate--2-oxoglutarate transaminase [Gammaproteobacteria bacterium]|nr:4-aminobutyrate--2-oxoglutarate transaminase [Gammaproteobacteria bacterium]